MARHVHHRIAAETMTRSVLILPLLLIFGCAHRQSDLAQRPNQGQPASDFGHSVSPATPPSKPWSPEPLGSPPIP